VITIVDVVNPPTGAAVNQHENERLLLTKILKRDGDLRVISFNCRFPDRELLDLRVLRVVKRIAIDHADFTF